MRSLLLTALLLTLPSAAAISLASTTPIAGHAAGGFGLSDEPFGRRAGGAAWSADGSLIYTLDTARELNVWRATDGTLQRGQRLTAPAFAPDERPDVPSTELSLSGTADAQGLPLTARGWKAGQPSLWRYRLDTGSGRATKDAACPADLETNLICAGGTRVWQQGGTIRWQRGGETRTLTLPAGRETQVPHLSGLALSQDGTRLAALVLDGKDVRMFGGAGVLLTWDWNTDGAAQAPEQIRLGEVLLYPGAQLGWVGERVLLASNVYNTGDEYGSGGSRVGQLLALVAHGKGPVWTLGADAKLRGAFPSPDGRLFVTVRGGSVPEVRRVADGGFVRSLGAAVRDAVPLSGGRTLLAVQDGAGFGRIVRHEPGRLTTLYWGPQVPEHLTANADGSRIAAVSGDDGRTLRLLDAAGRVLREWRARERVSDLAFSPDGLVLSAALGWSGGDGVQAWRVADGTAYPLPAGTQFPVSQVVIRPQNGQQGPLVAAERGTNAVLWKLPEKASVRYAVPSPDGAWLAGTGLSSASTEQIPPNRERGTVNRFARVEARTGKSGPVLNVPVAHPDDVYAGWGLAAFDGQRVLLSESSGDGCGGFLYGFQLADLSAGRLLDTPARLSSGYARLMGCGHYAPWPEADFAPDGRLLIRDGNRLDWWALK